MEIDGLYFQETLSNATNGFANIEIRNTTDKTISFKLDHPLQAFHVPEEHKINFELYHVEHFLSTFKNNT